MKETNNCKWYKPYNCFVSKMLSESHPHGMTSSLQPIGIPLYPMPTILFSSLTMQAPTWKECMMWLSWVSINTNMLELGDFKFDNDLDAVVEHLHILWSCEEFHSLKCSHKKSNKKLKTVGSRCFTNHVLTKFFWLHTSFNYKINWLNLHTITITYLIYIYSSKHSLWIWLTKLFQLSN